MTAGFNRKDLAGSQEGNWNCLLHAPYEVLVRADAD
jgi:hypothetical protein